jgi:hypothetical protein
MDQLNRIMGGHPDLVYASRLAVAQVQLERLPYAAYVTGSQECLGDMRASHHAFLPPWPETASSRSGAPNWASFSTMRAARVVRAFCERSSMARKLRMVGIESVPQDMQIHAAVEGRDLHSRNHLEPVLLAEGDRLLQSIHGIVVGQRDCDEPDTASGLHELFGSPIAVGERRVHVEIGRLHAPPWAARARLNSRRPDFWTQMASNDHGRFEHEIRNQERRKLHRCGSSGVAVQTDEERSSLRNM